VGSRHVLGTRSGRSLLADDSTSPGANEAARRAAIRPQMIAKPAAGELFQETFGKKLEAMDKAFRRSWLGAVGADDETAR